MDFGLSDEQAAFRRSVAEFARRELQKGDGEPAAVRRRDRAGEFFREGWRKCAEFGVLALPLPDAYGGLGRDVVDCTLAM